MKEDFNQLLRMFVQTLQDPAGAGRTINALRWPHDIGWRVLAATTVLGAILVQVRGLLFGWPEALFVVANNPIGHAVIAFGMTVVLVFVLYYAGRAMGGSGTFGAALLSVAWFNVVVLILTTIQFLTLLVAPPLEGIVALITFGLEIWVLLQLLNALHGFNSLFKAFGLLILASFGVVIGFGAIIAVIGGLTTLGP